MEVQTYPEELRLQGKTKPLQYMIDKNGCWNCVSHSDKGNGYRRIKRGDKQYFVHRYVYEMEHGFIDGNKVVMHKCDNKSCMNPEHLTLGTSKDNYQDAKQKNRNSKGSIHGMSKLTEEDIVNIRQDSRSLKKIAADYGVCSTNISAIKNRKTWKHV